MPRILHVCLAGSYTDNFLYHENLLPKFHKRLGFECMIIAPQDSYDSSGQTVLEKNEAPYVNENGVTVQRLKYSRIPLAHRLRHFQGFFNALETYGPDIVFAHGIQFIDTVLLLIYARRHPDTQIFVDNHVDSVNSARNIASRWILHGVLWKSLAQAMRPRVIQFYGVTPARVDFLRTVYGLPEQKTSLLVMGADDDEVARSSQPHCRLAVRKEFNIHEDDILIVTGGKIDPFKNQMLDLARAVKAVQSSRLRLLLFGSIDKSMEVELARLIDGDKVQFAGWAPAGRSYDLFAAADLAVFPGRHSIYWEQACGQGLPMIVRRWPGMEHVDLGGNCMFVDDDGVDPLVASLQQIPNDPEALIRMRAIATQRGIPAFSYLGLAQRSLATQP